MGSHSTNDLAYIAGFLDGDGSLMFQVKQRRDGKRKWRFMATICLYQDSRHREPLLWIRDTLGIGYLSDRKDGMTELRINGFRQVRDIIEKLLPFIRFKQIQAGELYSAVCLLSRKSFLDLDQAEVRKLIDCIITVQNNNYATRIKRTKEQLLSLLELTP